MSTAVQALPVMLLVAGALLLGLRWGRSRERTRAAAANKEAFAAGFRAGHLQGWGDGQAARVPGAAAILTEPAAAPHPVRPAQPVPAVPQVQPVRPARPAQPAQPVWVGQYQSAPAAWIAPQGQPRPTPVQPAATPPRPPGPAFPQESAADRAARKEKRDRQNINTTLYVASLLLVAAGSLFIGTALPAVLRFAGVVAITAMFYTGGLILHTKAPGSGQPPSPSPAPDWP